MKMHDARENADWKDGFLFLANDVALDFLNTRPVLNGKPIELLADFKALLRWFCAADLLNSRNAAGLERRWADSRRARRAAKAIRELREKLRQEIPGWKQSSVVHHSTVHELNRLMAEHPVRTRLQLSGQKMVVQSYSLMQEPEDLIGRLAYEAAALFSNVDPTRVRKCDQCVLHFHDTSKKGTRRWCSMRLCGNRLKVAAYAARKRLCW